MIATIDLSSFTDDSKRPHDDSEQVQAGRALVAALHTQGFAQVIGHGLSQVEIDQALNWTKMLFDLPYEDKMKAPHPPGSIPHRGYSGIGKEKVYSHDDVTADEDESDVGKSLRKISDFKESYEIGSECDPVQQNIWLPEDALPNFRSYMTDLYIKLCAVSKIVLRAISIGLGLDSTASAALTELISDHHCQLRLLHYPAISKEKLENEMIARLPAHHDWGTFTMLFQDSRGGLELQDPATQCFHRAEPKEGAFVINIGDMLQRFTNDYFISAVHRVSLPDLDNAPSSGIPARYSIPFFVCPDFSYTVSTHPKFISGETPAKYDPVKFDEYGVMVSKYQYQVEELP
ncbi:hypothetical protein GQX73_g5399 [Xylaria multiplex]|uniref:Fe2OG dioxygenase domain-containing protein n=1 Tax=Xylaria multiplex TaxID=323545 RepID=A0A7C8ING7_9PEZI|nr:hypothetical protein GQX73_g5399 [Xylaria multiplex]